MFPSNLPLESNDERFTFTLTLRHRVQRILPFNEPLLLLTVVYSIISKHDEALLWVVVARYRHDVVVFKAIVCDWGKQNKPQTLISKGMLTWVNISERKLLLSKMYFMCYDSLITIYSSKLSFLPGANGDFLTWCYKVFVKLNLVNSMKFWLRSTQNRYDRCLPP